MDDVQNWSMKINLDVPTVNGNFRTILSEINNVTKAFFRFMENWDNSGDFLTQCKNSRDIFDVSLKNFLLCVSTFFA